MKAIKVPSFKLLSGFEASARLGSFSRAAEELSVSQSAISHQIQLLEDQVGQSLFRRKGRGVELTMAGVVLYKSTVRSLDVIRSGLNHIGTYLDPGLVVLVCPAPLAQGWLQPKLDDLSAQLPSLCPLISTDETARYIDELDVDLTITDKPLQQSDVESVKLLEDTLVTVCAPDVAKMLKRFAQQPHATLTRWLCLESDITDEKIGRELRERFEGFHKAAIYDDARLLLDAAIRGRGIACVSRLLAEDTIARGKLVALKQYSPIAGRTFWLSRASGNTRSVLVRNFFDWLIEQSATHSLI